MDQVLLCLKKCLFTILILSINWTVGAQTFATTINSEDEVDNSANAIDGNLSTQATIRANSGIAVGIGAYDGHLELEFPSTLLSNNHQAMPMHFPLINLGWSRTPTMNFF